MVFFLDLAEGEKGSLGLLKEGGFSTKDQVTEQRCSDKVVVERQILLPESVLTCSHMAITDEALVAKVNRYPTLSTLSFIGILDDGSWTLRMLPRW